MNEVLHHKVVVALPTKLEPNSIYYVRAGDSGFNLYVTNNLGVVVAQPLKVLDLGELAYVDTNGVLTQYLRGDGTWVTPPDTKYSAMTAAALQTGTNNTGRVISAKVLHDWLISKGYITEIPPEVLALVPKPLPLGANPDDYTTRGKWIINYGEHENQWDPSYDWENSGAWPPNRGYFEVLKSDNGEATLQRITDVNNPFGVIERTYYPDEGGFWNLWEPGAGSDYHVRNYVDNKINEVNVVPWLPENYNIDVYDAALDHKAARFYNGVSSFAVGTDFGLDATTQEPIVIPQYGSFWSGSFGSGVVKQVIDFAESAVRGTSITRYKTVAGWGPWSYSGFDTKSLQYYFNLFS